MERLFGFEDGEALGVGLHHAVLNAIVDHLDEVAGAGGAYVTPALGLAGGESFEDGGEALDGSFVAADHERVTLLKAPDSAGGAAVDELEAGGDELRVAALGVLVVGVAAVDDGVAPREQAFEACDGVVDGIASGDHDPDGAGGAEVLDEV